MQSRWLAVFMVLFSAGAFAVRDRSTRRLAVGLLYQRGITNVDNVFTRSLMSHPHNSKYTFRILKEHYEDGLTVMEKVCTLLGRGAIAIVAMTPPQPIHIAYEQLSVMSNAYHIPLITYSVPENGEETLQFGLVLKPSTVRASLDVMQYYGWKNVIYVKDERIEATEFQEEMESGHSPYNFTIQVVLIVNGDIDAVVSFLSTESTMDSEDLRIVLNTATEVAKKIILTYATHPINKRIHFLIVEPLIDVDWATKIENANLKLTTFNLVDENSRFQLMKGKNSSLVDSLLSAEAGAILGGAFDRLHRFKPDVLNYATDSDRDYLNGCIGSPSTPLIHGLAVSLEIKRNSSVKGYTGNLEFDIRGRRRNYVLRVTETTSYGAIEIGTWSDRTSLKVHLQMLLPVYERLPSESTEKSYVVTSILEVPYLVKQGKGYVGFCKDLMDLLSAQLGFKYGFKLVDDGRYGTYNNYTKTWNGMIGEVVNAKADMAVAALTMTSRRMTAIEFTVPFQNYGITLLMKIPNETPSFCYLAFHPFTWQLWIFILFVYVTFGVLFIVISHYVNSSKHQGEDKGNISRWHARWPLRALFLVCLVFTVIIVSMYVASLGTILSRQQAFWPNSSKLHFKNIFEQSVLTGTPKILLLNHGSSVEFFQKSKTSLYRRYWSQVTADTTHFVNTYQEGIERILDSNGETAVIIDSLKGEYLSNKHCDLFVTSGFLNVGSFGIALHPNSELRGRLNEAILSLSESGSLRKLHAKWWKPRCPHKQTTERKQAFHGRPIQLMELDGLFYILTAGFVLIALTTAIQLFFQKRKTDVQKVTVLDNESSNQTSSHIVLCYKQAL